MSAGHSRSLHCSWPCFCPSQVFCPGTDCSSVPGFRSACSWSLPSTFHRLPPSYFSSLEQTSSAKPIYPTLIRPLMSRGKSNPKRNRTDFSIRGASLIKLNKSDEERKDRGSERWKYPPIRARIIPASQQRPVSYAQEQEGGLSKTKSDVSLIAIVAMEEQL